ncbi:unnamed protein product [Bemisia tabaci]|uniref:Ionotropic receptor n=1 Tax=Bemisia tabaci TaxID=7038 RepID=A0A9P0EXE4_BEMTA|nr:unnamed protein product [Bemisia tabaci]
MTEKLPHFSNLGANISFLTQVCENTLNRSKLRLAYLVNLSQDTHCTQLVQYLHSNSIATITSSLADTNLYATDELSKSMIFVVDDCSDIINFMLGSMYGSRDSNLDSIHHPSKLQSLSENATSTYRRSAFPNICILHDPKTGAIVRDHTRPCDQTIEITIEDIKDGSYLRDDLLNFTGGAYGQVWNPDNYLVFVVLSGGNGQALACDLFFTFRLIWRIFKGRKTVICSMIECYWYDSFFNKTHVYRGSRGEEYFDFAWRSMNGKQYNYYDVSEFLYQNIDQRTGLREWQMSVSSVVSLLGKLRSGRIVLPPVGLYTELEEYKFAVKYDLIILLIDAIPRLRSKNFENFDQTPVTDFGSLCLSVPREGFKPLYLTVFKCFNLTVWVCLLVTIGTFLLLQHFHKWFQLRKLRHFYSEYEIIQYEGLSTALTIYRYLLCVAQPRLLLGKLPSGKILFGIFAFAAIVLNTLLQSGMMNILNTRVRYDDIDTLQQFAESDLLVQSSNLVLDRDFFMTEEGFHYILKRLVGSFSYSNEILISNILYNYNYTFEFSANSMCPWCESIVRQSMFKVAATSVLENLRAIMASDAFLTITSSRVPNKNWIVFDFGLTFEYHTLRECFASYPLSYFIPRHMFARDEVNYLLQRSFEVGIVAKSYEEDMFLSDLFEKELFLEMEIPTDRGTGGV